MSNETYIGHRYVPQVEGEWSNNKAYEELSIVLYEGNSYTSKQKVPEGVDINNTNFWALSGNYNAQMEQLKKEFDTVVRGVTVDSEVVLARGDETTLDDRLNKIESEKANKKQEEWITPTLMNGWEPFNDISIPKYRKDEFGKVHFKGSMKRSSGTGAAFVMPLGYRNVGTTYGLGNSNNTSLGIIYVVNGSVFPTATTTPHISLDLLSFYAEQ